MDGTISYFFEHFITIALTAALFGYFGWWLRGKIHAPSTHSHSHTPSSLAPAKAADTDSGRVRSLEARLKDAEERARNAEAASSRLKAETESKLAALVPSADLEKARLSLTEARREADDFKAKFQRSEDGFKAARTADAKLLEQQNEIAKLREEVARLLSAAPVASGDSSSEIERMKATVRTAETLAGQERRRADEYKEQAESLRDKMAKHKEEIAALKASTLDAAAKARLEAELAAAREDLQKTEHALTTERNRISVLDREFNNAKSSLAKCRNETTTLQSSLTATEEAKNALEADNRRLVVALATAESSATASAAAALTTTVPAAAAPAPEPTPAPAPVIEITQPLTVDVPSTPVEAPKAEIIAPQFGAVQSMLGFAAAPAAEEAPAKKEKIEAATEALGKRVVRDDFKILEGIGPKIEELIHADGITTWQQLCTTSVERLKDILSRAGERFVMHDPTTWPQQATLAYEEKWQELRALQDVLDGGRIVQPASPEA